MSEFDPQLYITAAALRHLLKQSIFIYVDEDHTEIARVMTLMVPYLLDTISDETLLQLWRNVNAR